jgi:hypothetical protein
MKSAIFGGVLLLVCASAFADNGIYVGAGITQSRIDNVGGDFGVGNLNSFRIRNNEWKLIAGVRLLSFLGAEVNYMDLGRDHRNIDNLNFHGDAKAWSGYLVGYVPVPFVDLYGKVGAARTKLNERLDYQSPSLIITSPIDDSSTNFAYGVGAQIKLGSIAGRLEYERFDVDHTDGVKLLTLGVTYTFL